MRLLLIMILVVLATPALGSTVTGGSITGGVMRTASPGGGPVASCTDGVDCYCDRVADSGDPIYDASILGCEDFENDDYYLNTANSMVAGSGSPYDRGANSRWFLEYGQPSYKGNLSNTDPTPDIGTACGLAVCAGTRTYCSSAQGALTPAGGADCWGPGINATSQLWIMRSGDFDDEIGSLTLTGGIGVSADIGDGNTSMAQRVPLGPNEGDGGTGRMTWGEVTEIGVTQLFAYASNVPTSGVLGMGWKMDESADAGTGDQPFIGAIGPGGNGDPDYYPFEPFVWVTSNAACEAMMSGVTANLGAAGCINGDTKLGFSADGTVFPNFAVDTYQQSGDSAYYRPTDWPWGTWGCVRAYWTGLGTSDVTVKMWFNDVLVLDITGLDGTVFLENGYREYWFNNYSNQSVGAGLSAVTYRYKDNLHVRAGEPVTCASMGFPG